MADHTANDLLETYGDITTAAKIVGCSRATFRKYLDTGFPITCRAKQDTVLFLPDLHAPFHDLASLELMRSYLNDRCITKVVLGGDFCDFFEVSAWSSTPRMHFDEEVQCCIDALKMIKGWFPFAEIVYIEGNHENRLTRYIQSKAQDLSRLDCFSVKSLLQLDELGIEYVNNIDLLERTQCPYKIGNLYYLHGHEIAGGGSVNLARSKFLKVQQNIIFGHHHQSQSAIIKQMNEYKGSWSVGCMCTVNPSYHSLGNQHTQGFAIIEYDNDGDFTVHNKIIINGKVK